MSLDRQRCSVAQTWTYVHQVYPTYGDVNKAWAPASVVGKHFLEVQFKTPCRVRQLHIYETSGPGAVSVIMGQYGGVWAPLWTGMTRANIASFPIARYP